MDTYNQIAVDAMHSVLGRAPLGFQLPSIAHVLRMMSGELSPSTVLLVQPTGTGKSTVPLTCSVIDCGVSIVIENTLALGIDQVVKARDLCMSSSKLRVECYHLDSITTEEHQDIISSLIVANCISKRDTCFVLYSSPEMLLKKCWVNFIDECVKNNILSLFCIDEIHLFVEFGLGFRHEFQSLRSRVFEMIKLPNNLPKVPIILMTATFNHEYLKCLEEMIGFKIENKDIFWASVSQFQKRHININFNYSVQQFSLVKSQLVSHLKEMTSHKAIIITNTAKKAIVIQQKVDQWLDIENIIKGDTVLVIGEQQTELKLAYTSEFTNCQYNETECNDENILKPRILVGTTGCIGAGLDCNDVHYIVRMGIPNSIISFIQEMGRCGRNLHTTSNSDSSNDSFDILFNIRDYIYLYERCFKIEATREDDSCVSDNAANINMEFLQMQIQHLNKVCSLMFLDYGCWHFYIEKQSSFFNTTHQDEHHNSCYNKCPYCRDDMRMYIKTMSRLGVCCFLVDTMTNTNKQYSAIELGELLYKYPNAGTKIYNRKHAKQPEKKAHCFMTILQLILVDIIRLKIEVCTNPSSICMLVFDGIEPKYNKDKSWQNIKHVD